MLHLKNMLVPGARKLILAFVCAFGIAPAFAQIPTIEWQKSFGGSDEDRACDIQQTSDSGYIVVGATYSTDMDVVGNHGNYDYWVLKLTKTGALQWKKCFGGPDDDQPSVVRQTIDGGYIINGYTSSGGGNVTGFHGFHDAWVVKLTSTGALQWQKSIGGSIYDEGYDVQQTSDGGYIMTGGAGSSDGDLTANRGFADYWIVKLSSAGAIQWHKEYGGTSGDYAISIKELSDGNYIVAGTTSSNDGDVGPAVHGSIDYWIMKLNPTGNVLWKKVYGGDFDDGPTSVWPTSDGGYLLSGSTSSTAGTGDVGTRYDFTDLWVVKVSSTGVKQWTKCYGGSYSDWPGYASAAINDGIILCATTSSNDGDISGNHGQDDGYILRTNGDGVQLWSKTFGGTQDDGIAAVRTTFDGGFILAGYSNSTDGDLTDNKGYGDLWVVKLSPDPALGVSAKTMDAISVVPNPTTGLISLKGADNTCSIRVFNAIGQQVTTVTGSNNISISELPAAVYLVRVFDEQGKLIHQEKLVKQ